MERLIAFFVNLIGLNLERFIRFDFESIGLVSSDSLHDPLSALFLGRNENWFKVYLRCHILNFCFLPQT